MTYLTSAPDATAKEQGAERELIDLALKGLEAYILKTEGQGKKLVISEDGCIEFNERVTLQFAHMYGKKTKPLNKREQVEVGKCVQDLIRILKQGSIQDQNLIHGITTLATHLATRCPNVQILEASQEAPRAIGRWVQGEVERVQKTMQGV